MMDHDHKTPPAQSIANDQQKPRFRIGDFYPVSSTLFNGEPATEIFFQGCPWHCKQCQQPALMSTLDSGCYDWQDILYYLMGRRGLIDHVVFNGAEPLSQSHLIEAILQCKSMGFVVGLHTCGIYPLRLKTVLPLIDWVWFEIFGLPENYAMNNGLPGSGHHAWGGLRMALDSGLPVVCELYAPQASALRQSLPETATQLANIGVQHLVLTVGSEEPAQLGEYSHELQDIARQFAHISVRPGKRAPL